MPKNVKITPALGQIDFSLNAGVSSASIDLFDSGVLSIGSTSPISLNVDGNDVLWVNASSVGIGTTAPLHTLDVRGDIYSTGIVTAVAYYGIGANLTDLNATNLTSGTVNSARISGAYPGITSVGNLTQLFVTGISTFGAAFFDGALYDINNQAGTSGQLLSSTGTGIDWIDAPTTGISGSISEYQVAYGGGTDIINGIATFVYKDGKLGIGTDYPTQMLHVNGPLRLEGSLYDDANSAGTLNQHLISLGNGVAWTSVGTFTDIFASGISTATAYYGIGANLTDLNATQLTSGTVPSARLSGAYPGITSVGTLTQLAVSGVSTLNITVLQGNLIDVNSSGGVSGQYLQSTGAGIEWTSFNSFYYEVLDAGIVFGSGSNTLMSISTFVYRNEKVGLGTDYPLQTLDVRGNIYSSGFVTSVGFYGPGTYITNLNADNLTSGTVASARISGAYPGITSVGTLTQLLVSGISTFGAIFLDGALYDSNNETGTSGQVLSSTGTGVDWIDASSGSMSGTIGTYQVAYGQDLDVLGGIGTFVYRNYSLGLGTDYPLYTADVRGTLGVSNTGYFQDVSVVGGLYDSLGTSGTYGQYLTSISTGIAWTSFSDFYYELNDTEIAFGFGADVITGISTFVYKNYKVGIGTANPTEMLHVHGNLRIYGSLYDSTNDPGTVNQVLAVTASGVGWTDLSAGSGFIGGSIAEYQVAYGSGTDTLIGMTTFVYKLGKLGIGTQEPNYELDLWGGLHVTGISTLEAVYLDGALYDSNNEAGTSGQLLSSTGTGVDWIDAPTSGISGSISEYQVAYGGGTDAITGIATFVYKDGKLGIGTNYPTQMLHVNGPLRLEGSLYDDANSAGTLNQHLISLGNGVAWTSVGNFTDIFASGIATATAYYGIGANLTDLNATQLTSGTVPSARLSGTYAGITSVGTLTQLNVSGVSTMNTTVIQGALLDGNNTAGTVGQYLRSSGSGIEWTSFTSFFFNLSDSEIVFAQGSDAFNGVSTFVYWNEKLGVGTAYPNSTLHVVGDSRVTGVSTVNSLYVGGILYDSNNVPGGPNQVLIGTSGGIAWTSFTPLRLNINDREILFGIGTDLVTSDTNFVYSSSGYVGIGTTTPTRLLHVHGDFKIAGTVYDANNSGGTLNQVLSRAATGVAWTDLSAGSGFIGGGIAQYQVAYGSATDVIAGTANFVYKSDSLGVGTAEPQYTLTSWGDFYTNTGATIGTSMLIKDAWGTSFIYTLTDQSKFIQNSNFDNRRALRVTKNDTMLTTYQTYQAFSIVTMPLNTMLTVEGMIVGFGSGGGSYEAGSYFGAFINLIGVASNISTPDLNVKFAGPHTPPSFSLTGVGNTVFLQAKAGTATTWVWRTTYTYLLASTEYSGLGPDPGGENIYYWGGGNPVEPVDPILPED